MPTMRQQLQGKQQLQWEQVQWQKFHRETTTLRQHLQGRQQLSDDSSSYKTPTARHRWDNGETTATRREHLQEDNKGWSTVSHQLQWHSNSFSQRTGTIHDTETTIYVNIEEQVQSIFKCMCVSLLPVGSLRDPIHTFLPSSSHIIAYISSVSLS